MWGGRWVRVAKVSDIAEGKAIVVRPQEKAIALFRSGGHFYAIDNLCPHRGAPLAEGNLENNQVTCAWHAWTFDVRTGACETAPEAKVKSYPVKVEKDEIFLKKL